MRVPFDKAYEEEKILNTVFPTEDICRHQLPLSEQKTNALDEDIHNSKKVSRCFCCAEETFNNYDDAVTFRKGVMCSAVFFIVAVFVKNIVQITLTLTNF